ncbi:unnamed protein product [Polarella glacialis]|uniref:Uncharacterized protein n=1 Tax=Polarella glacialis TaxID=89957 RepID=A0A813H232_POLGL|nr:unnamed protein product [Polarella glacialis]CAE8631718.1 unnamed protein product [Polarella glacialis]CAE8728877.1 unnamed protein product [Polarella glacialis]|mmetsp:Transcript_8675/g.13781  ORF Transcript_8675/g.13781 Transcript_8675/m.13781 type:complete len:202 (-) Transcript_8675:135-740(-)
MDASAEEDLEMLRLNHRFAAAETASATRRRRRFRPAASWALLGCSLVLALSGRTSSSLSSQLAWAANSLPQLGLNPRLGAGRSLAKTSLWAGPRELSEVKAGDRFVGWLKHPVITKGNADNLVIEVGPGDNEGTWRMERQRGEAFEGPFKIERGDDGEVDFRDTDTVFKAVLNAAGAGTISGKVVQNGLTWGGSFEAKLEG